MNDAYSPSASLWNAREVSVSFDAWDVRASRIRGWQWPWFTAEYPDRKSMYRLPSTS